MAHGWSLGFTPPPNKVLLLCPLKEFYNIPDGTVLTTVQGDSITKRKGKVPTANMDVRGGYLAFGLLVDEPVKKTRRKEYRDIDEPWEPSKK